MRCCSLRLSIFYSLAAPVVHTHCCITELTLVLLVLDCVCTRKAHSGTYRTRIRTLLPFRPSLLGGVSCVYSKCSARDSTDIDFNGQRNGQLHSARRSVEDRLTAIRRRADNCPCAVWQPAPSVAGRQRWGIRAGRERRLAIRSRRAHKAIIIIAAEGRIQPVRHSTRYL